MDDETLDVQPGAEESEEAYDKNENPSELAEGVNDESFEEIGADAGADGDQSGSASNGADSNSSGPADGQGGWQQAVDSMMSDILGSNLGKGGIGVGLGSLAKGVVGMFTSNPILRYGVQFGSVALSYIPGIQTAFGKGIQKLAGMFGDDTQVGQVLNTVGTKIVDWSQANQTSANYQAAADMAGNAQTTLASHLVENEVSAEATQNYKDSMGAAGAQLVSSGFVFNEVSEDEADVIKDSMQDYSEAACNTMAARLDASDSPKSRQMVSNMAMDFVEGWCTYDYAAREALNETVSVDDPNYQAASMRITDMTTNGLSGSLDGIIMLQQQYGEDLFSEEQQARLTEIISDYGMGGSWQEYYASMTEPSVPMEEQQVSTAALNGEEASVDEVGVKAGKTSLEDRPPDIQAGVASIESYSDEVQNQAAQVQQENGLQI